MALRDTTPTTERGSVAGLFKNYSQAEKAIADLRSAGFTSDQIGLARAEGGAGTETAEHQDRGFWDKVRGAFGGQERTVDESDYSYSNDFEGSLTGSGLTPEEARYFGSNIHSGVLVTVRTTGGRAAEAITILERNGADIGSGAVQFGKQQKTTTTAGMGEHRIQLLGEMLRIHKERISRGEVRLRKEVVTETKNVQVPVSREELVIERTDVSGEQPVTGQIGSEKEVRIPLSEEKVRVEKQPVVTGEVRVGKREVQETQTVSDEVRHEEVKVDKEGDVKVRDEEALKDKGKGKRIA
jgi:uncharacterized protein (TIGR02271 family)